MAKLPSRCKKYSVGKEIGGAVYVHRNYEALLPDPVKIASKHLPTEFDYTVVKFVEKESCVSFISCPEFDSADEPVVGDIVRVDGKGSKRFFRQHADPFIYHHKWLFVMDDYTGFDVSTSKIRSELWLAIENIDKRRIGRLSYWREQVLPRLYKEFWYSTQDACKLLGVSNCELSHLRNSGKLLFRKEHNAFFYRIDS